MLDGKGIDGLPTDAQLSGAVEHAEKLPVIKDFHYALNSALEHGGTWDSAGELYPKTARALENKALAEAADGRWHISEHDQNELVGMARAEHGYSFPLSEEGIPIIKTMRSNVTLGSHDIVGTMFWVACASMLASTGFFFAERYTVPMKWKTSLTVSGLVTLIAFWNYCYMREAWVLTQNSPTVYRYTDWLITVPLLMLEFYLILKAAMPNLGTGILTRLMIETVGMLGFGYAGETGCCSVLAGFVVAVIFWGFMIGEIANGECQEAARACPSKAVQKAYDYMVKIVVYGWAIYPLGYYLTLLGPTATYHEQSAINICYNLADLVNKTGFGFCVWSCAISE
jgi:bacteriorhodopsin